MSVIVAYNLKYLVYKQYHIWHLEQWNYPKYCEHILNCKALYTNVITVGYW